MNAVHKSFTRNILSLSITTAGILLAATASAQQQAIEEISVTGSRITLTSGMETPVPVTVITTTELRDYEPGSTISQQLDALPQFFNNGSPQRGDGGNPSVGSGGPGALNIRNLNSPSTGAGISRTLTLLDGARVVPTDKRGTVNVDMFPSALMRSVDVVTGGASAAYGADALGGVVNFVLDREFEGLKFSTGVGMHEYERTGKQYEVSLAGGRAFLDDRLHLIGSLEARHIDEIQPDRERWDSSQYQWGYVTNPAWVAARCTVNVRCDAGPQRLTMMNVASVTGSPTGLIRGTGTSLDWMKFSLDGTRLEPFNLGTLAALPGTPGSTQTLSGGPEADINYETSSSGPSGMEVVSRSSLFGAKYDFTDRISGFVQLIVGRTESNDTANNANFSYTDNFAPRIAVDNAYLPEAVRQVMIERNLTEIPIHKTSQQFDGRPELGSTRVGKNVFTQWQYSFGVDWEFIDGWNLRASWQQGESKRNSTAYNLLQVDRAQLAMDAVRDASGNIVCRVKLFNPTLEQLAASVEGRISNVPLNPYIPAGVPGNTQPLPYPVEPRGIDECIPFNYFGSGNMSAEVIDYIGTDRFNIGYVDQDFAEIFATGNLHEGWGAGPIGFAGGVTWRDQQFITYATPLDVDLLAPMVNVPELGIRGMGPGYSTSTALNLFSGIPKVGGQSDVWEWFTEVSVPVWQSQSGDQRLDTDVAFRRSTYDRSGVIDSWKAGASIQVFSDLRLRLAKSRDVREPSFAELFDAQGSGETIIDPVFAGESTLINTVRGGNPDLRPEYADTRTIGFVYRPTFLEVLDGLSLSMDYYDVDIKDAVARLTAQRILNECVDTGSPQLCGLIQRDPVTNRVTSAMDVFLNVAAARARGLDLELTYRKEINLFSDFDENISLRALAGRTFERSDTAPNAAPLDKSGYLGMPKLTGNFTATYGIGNYSFQLQAQYVDSVFRDGNGVWVEGIQVDDNTVASMTWFNGRIGYNGELDNGGAWSLGLNVQNILNRDPPLFGGGNNTYDQYGRRYNLNVNFSW
ncbi:MAG: TonB-dependent receptor [Pseudomonadales bacterium]|jgi:outer membrane receptor protein involved in Fe transport|nr:TonB-dependent receptor [Pseudomonadales bacterium]